MKSRFTSVDIKASVAEILRSEAIGLRVINVYDIDNKTYLIRLVHADVKKVILIESGSRIHLTDYDWPKNVLPSSFSMKCRKHLKGRRLSMVKQLGIDRVVDFTFGYNEAAYHLIVELYDRGNIILTDHEYQILQLLRVRADTDKDVKYAVREIYHSEYARQKEPLISKESLMETLLKCKPGETLKKLLNPMFVYGPAVLENCLMMCGLQTTMKLFQQFDPNSDEDMTKLMTALEKAEEMLNAAGAPDMKGYIIQKKEVRPATTEKTESPELLTYNEFHPFLYQQHESSSFIEFPTFNEAVDEFFSKLESQKIDMKALQVEKAALKRLENVRLDHEKRVDSLKHTQDADMLIAGLIEMNLDEVERAIATVNSAIANQIDWEEIQEIVEEAKAQNDPVASLIKSLNLSANQIILSLSDPYEQLEHQQDEGIEDDVSFKKKNKNNRVKKTDVVIDLNLTAFANARNYHNKRRHAAQKEQKTLQASKKALKSAEQKTQETLKEMQTSKMISKTRKNNWFEKFYWFISSENYLVIAGRDQQQNELIVKRYLKPGDLYVHADLHGASSVIVKNPSGGEVPPKTLNDAGTMAICYSAAWDARVVTSAWWVYHNQVSKTAPSGEYLTTGSFMIRGKKNYLPPSYLVMGFSVMYKLDESSIANHINDRKIRVVDDDSVSESTENDTEIMLDDVEEGDLDENESHDPPKSNNDDISDNQNFDDLNGDTQEEKVENLETSVKENLNLNDINESDNHQNVGELSSPEEEFAFPDTNIELKHVEGESFQLYRGISSSSQQNGNHADEDDYVYLGDDVKVSMKRQEPEVRKPRLSAKQRRDLKKKNKLRSAEDGDDTKPVTNKNSETLQEIDEEKSSVPNKEAKKGESKQQAKTKPPEQPVVKRGQKGKQKRIKDKYKDQDDEDKELMQQLLRSHEPEKSSKKKTKEKYVNKAQTGPKLNNPKTKPISDAYIIHNPDGEPVTETVKPEPDDEDLDDLNEEEKENVSVLDSLTGCPREEDVLLYAIPICAPYSSLQNFKFKVKLTPGSGRRGKAAKTALHMFQTAKETTDWERDLLKCLKDVDISRNIPGKVKVSAPNLQKAKKK